MADFSNCVFLIPARRGSKGYPLKNRALFDATAMTIPPELSERVFVSTNDESIKYSAMKYGFKVVHRPESISADESSLKDTLRHFIDTEDISDNLVVILLYLTYPERTWDDIDKIYTHFLGSTSESMICCEEVVDHPYLSFYEKEDGKAKLVVDHKKYRRQDYPKCVKQSMFFACYKPAVVDDLHDLLFEKNTIFYKLPNRKIDVDYKEDYIKWKK